MPMITLPGRDAHIAPPPATPRPPAAAAPAQPRVLTVADRPVREFQPHPLARSLRLGSMGGMLVMMLGGLALAFWPFISADRQMAAFCAGLEAGTPAAQVVAAVQAQGLVGRIEGGLLHVADPPDMGRRHCSVALDAQQRVAPH